MRKEGRTKLPAVGLLGTQEDRFGEAYRFTLLRTRNPIKTRPVPNNPVLDGSGVRTELVPLVKVIDPPLYAVLLLKSNCAVEPDTVAPVYQVPDTVPVRV
jgi:hypothetical protein